MLCADCCYNGSSAVIGDGSIMTCLDRQCLHAHALHNFPERYVLGQSRETCCYCCGDTHSVHMINAYIHIYDSAVVCVGKHIPVAVADWTDAFSHLYTYISYIHTWYVFTYSSMYIQYVHMYIQQYGVISPVHSAVSVRRFCLLAQHSPSRLVRTLFYQCVSSGT